MVVKHTNPCGVASASGCDGDILEAYRQAVRADPISAFGGIVAFNCELTAEMAKEIREFRSPTDDETRMFYEIVIAPSYTEEGLEVLKGKSKNLRILEAKPRLPSTTLRQVGGGWLQQASDSLLPEEIEFEVQSETQPTPEQMEALKFAWRCVKHVKSNAITVATNGRLLGMGSGQPNRVNSVRIALEKAADEVEGSVLASTRSSPSPGATPWRSRARRASRRSRTPAGPCATRKPWTCATNTASRSSPPGTGTSATKNASSVRVDVARASVKNASCRPTRVFSGDERSFFFCSSV